MQEDPSINLASYKNKNQIKRIFISRDGDPNASFECYKKWVHFR